MLLFGPLVICYGYDIPFSLADGLMVWFLVGGLVFKLRCGSLRELDKNTTFPFVYSHHVSSSASNKSAVSDYRKR